jgi:hypothetical protein
VNAYPGIPYTTCRESPVVVELYEVADARVWGQNSLVKHTHLVCNMECYYRRLHYLEETAERPFMLVASGIDSVIHYEDHYVIKMMKTIAVTPELTLNCHYDERGYLSFYELQPFLTKAVRDKENGKPPLKLKAYSLIPLEQEHSPNTVIASKLPSMTPKSEIMPSFKFSQALRTTDFFGIDCYPVRPRIPIKYEISYFNRGFHWMYHCETSILAYVYDDHNPFSLLEAMYTYLQESYASLTLPVSGTLKIFGLPTIYYVRPFENIDWATDTDSMSEYMTQEDTDDESGLE